MRISTVSSEVSALMRLMSAAPRDFFANRRSMATMSGRPLMIASSAAGVSASVNAWASVYSERDFSASS
jgi:hypothetical protein